MYISVSSVNSLLITPGFCRSIFAELGKYQVKELAIGERRHVKGRFLTIYIHTTYTLKHRDQWTRRPDAVAWRQPLLLPAQFA